jgi:hypothetical protein
MPGPSAVQRKMFGYPAGFINGNTFMGLFGKTWFPAFPKLSAKIFEKRSRKDYSADARVGCCSVARDDRQEEPDLTGSRSRESGASLKPKLSAKRKQSASTGKKSKAPSGRSGPGHTCPGLFR